MDRPWLRKGSDIPYSEAELDVIRDVELSLQEVADKLGPPRTYGGVKRMACVLGVKRRRGAWQPWELALLEDVSVPLVEVSRQVGRKLGTVYSEASLRGIVRGVQRGEQHYRWAGGADLWHRGPDWPAVRLTVLERDGYICQDCKLSDFNARQLHVHHIIPYRLRPVNDPRWLVTLCSGCHVKRPEHSWQTIPSHVEEALALA